MKRRLVPIVTLAACLAASFVLQACCSLAPCPRCAGPTVGKISAGNLVVSSSPSSSNRAWAGVTSGGSTNSTLIATGVFSAPQEACVYDISVHYGRKLTMVEVFAGPSTVSDSDMTDPSDAYLVERDPNDTPTGSGDWVRDNLPGSYDGNYDEYKLIVRVYYLNPSFGVDVHTYLFSNISSGTPTSVP